MASLKKEVAALLSRFDAAQEAFTANAADLKKVRKSHKKDLKKATKTHKKELKEANSSIDKLEEQVADLKKELMQVKQELTLAQAKVTGQGASAKKMDGRRGRKPGPKAGSKRGPGRPRKSTASTATETKKTDKSEDALTGVASGNGLTAATKATSTPKRRGRPAGSKNKITDLATATNDGKKRGPGRPRKTPATPPSPLVAIQGFGPAMARKFEDAGVTTPAQVARLSNAKMSEILDTVGPRYKNADDEKIQGIREAATAAK